MMVTCKKHGSTQYHSGILVSQDIADNLAASREFPEAHLMQFLYLGEIVNRFIISEKYRVINNIQSEKSLPLPKDYPDWYMNLVPACETCIEHFIILDE